MKSTTLENLIGKMPVIRAPTVRLLCDVLNDNNMGDDPHPKACGMSGNFMRFTLAYVVAVLKHSLDGLSASDWLLADEFLKSVEKAQGE